MGFGTPLMSSGGPEVVTANTLPLGATETPFTPVGEGAVGATDGDAAARDGAGLAVLVADDAAGHADAQRVLALAHALLACTAGVGDVDGAVGSDCHAARVVEPAATVSTLAAPAAGATMSVSAAAATRPVAARRAGLL